jgi:UDP-2,4-diacetamido-2,4,6-trideoxy-beta-L-altropyranose hydrolase
MTHEIAEAAAPKLMLANTLIVRADASVPMGTGHVMRCLALAQAWQDQAEAQGGRCIFAMVQPVPALERRLRSEGFEVVPVAASPGSPEDATQVAELARAHDARWIAVDGYQFSAEYHRRLKDGGRKLLLIDDSGHAGAYFADLVLDQNVSATDNFYVHREPYTRLLLGPHYSMLRREFKPWREWKRQIAPVGRKILITMGGSDPHNLTTRVIDALKFLKIEEVEARVAIGGCNPNIESVECNAVSGKLKVGVERDVANMAELIAWADVAISGAGSTCWEVCLLALPGIVIHLAENQLPIAEGLEKEGISIHLGGSEDVTPESIARKLEWLLLSPQARQEMSERGRRLVDGRGVERVISAMRIYGLHLRRAEEGDCRLLWEWANDPSVRAASFSIAPISWDEHLSWFKNKLQDTQSVIFIADDENGKPVAQIRFDRAHDREAEVDVTIANDRRGAGIASNLIDMAAQTVFLNQNFDRLCAWIKPGNCPSTKAFERAKFRRREATHPKGYSAILYVRDRTA